MERKLLGTILENGSNTVRIPLYSVDGSPHVWAPCHDGDDDLYDTGVEVGRIGSAWGGPAWDLQMEVQS